MHVQVQQLIMQGLQCQAEPIRVPSNQAPLVRCSGEAQPRLASMRIQQHRDLSQAPCTRNSHNLRLRP